MTQEEKDLLLKDLCARLPYGVKINENIQGDFTVIGLTTERVFTTCETEGCHNDFPIECVKPYLLPMSSMTDEEKEELKQEHIKDEKLYVKCLTRVAKRDRTMRGKVIIHYAMDWCNKNHFDYRGLIEKGIALDATGLNIY